MHFRCVIAKKKNSLMFSIYSVIATEGLPSKQFWFRKKIHWRKRIWKINRWNTNHGWKNCVNMYIIPFLPNTSLNKYFLISYIIDNNENNVFISDFSGNSLLKLFESNVPVKFFVIYKRWFWLHDEVYNNTKRKISKCESCYRHYSLFE